MNKKHHSVPRCYLDHFTINGQIHKYSKVRKQNNICSVDDVCESNYFYLITEKSWWKDLELEKDFFSHNVEPALGKMIETIENSVKTALPEGSDVVKLLINKDTRRSIASQIFIQFYRTPRFREYFKNKTLIRSGISSVTHEPAEEMVTDEVLVHALSTYINKPLFEKTVDYLSNNQWVIRYSDDDVFTVGNIGESRCFLYYPITPHIVLEIYDKDMKSLSPDYDNLLIRCDAEHKAFLNYHTIINAADDVILRDKDISAYSIDIKLNII